MKRSVFAVFPAAVLAFGMVVCAAPSARCGSTPSVDWCAFVDADGDSICDTCAGGGVHCGFIDADGDGVCDNGDSHCAAYCDADGDGVCDTCANAMCHRQTVSKSCAARAEGHHGSGHHSSGRRSSRHHC